MNYFHLIFLTILPFLCLTQKPDRNYALTRTVGSNSNMSSSDNSSGGFAILAFILVFVFIQISLFICCYCNTKRMKKKADLIRIKIGNEYSRIREEQYSNNGGNNLLRLNYYLVDPTNPIYRMWNGGTAIHYQQPIGFQSGKGPQISNFNQIY